MTFEEINNSTPDIYDLSDELECSERDIEILKFA